MQGRYLAYDGLTEDGSYHSSDIKVHWCLDTKMLAYMFKKAGLKNVEHCSCYEVKCEPVKNYPVLLILAKK